MRRSVAVLLIGLLAAPRPAAAQRQTVFAPVQPRFMASATSQPAPNFPDSTQIPRTYWLEGGLVLGSMGLLAGLTASTFCEGKAGCQIGLGALAAAILFPIGALIGGQIPK